MTTPAERLKQTFDRHDKEIEVIRPVDLVWTDKEGVKLELSVEAYELFKPECILATMRDSKDNTGKTKREFKHIVIEADKINDVVEWLTKNFLTAAEGP